jgi:hypothetical protein
MSFQTSHSWAMYKSFIPCPVFKTMRCNLCRCLWTTTVLCQTALRMVFVNILCSINHRNFNMNVKAAMWQLDGVGEIFTFCAVSRLTLRPFQAPIQWVPRALSLETAAETWMLATHIYLMPMSRMVELRLYPHSPIHRHGTIFNLFCRGTVLIFFFFFYIFMWKCRRILK